MLVTVNFDCHFTAPNPNHRLTQKRLGGFVLLVVFIEHLNSRVVVMLRQEDAQSWHQRVCLVLVHPRIDFSSNAFQLALWQVIGDMSIDMSKLASGAAYGASAGTIANGLLTRLSPDEWSAVGVLAGILVALFTLGINWYYKRKATLAQIKALQRWPTAPDINED